MIYLYNVDILDKIKPYIGFDKELTDMDCLIRRTREIRLTNDFVSAADLLAYVVKEHPQEVKAHDQNKRNAINWGDILDSIEAMLTNMAEKRLQVLQNANI